MLWAWKAVPSQMVNFVLLRSGMPIMLPSRQDSTLKQFPAKQDHGQLEDLFQTKSTFYFQQFVGNADQDTVVYHELSHAIRARYIRFRPTAWHGHISMRVEVYGCKGNAAFSSPKLAYHFLAQPPPYASEIGICGHKTENARRPPFRANSF